MPIVRTYHCDGCGTEFDFLHMNRDEPPPECGVCYAPTEQGVGRVNIGLSPASKVTDYAQRMTAESYGLTDLKTNLREGDTAAPNPQMKTPEGRKMLELATSGQAWQPPTGVAELLNLGKSIPKEERVAPMRDFHKRIKDNPVRMDRPTNRRPAPPQR